MNRNVLFVSLVILLLFLFIVPALSYYFLSPLDLVTISQVGEGILKYEGGELIAVITVNVSGSKLSHVYLVSASIENTSYKYILEGQDKIVLIKGQNILVIPFNVSGQPNLQVNKTYLILITLNQGEEFQLSAVYV